MQLSDEFIAKMKKRANANTVNDKDENAVIDDYCGGNVDDAYSMGVDDGEIYAFREVLMAIGVSWEE